MQEVKLTFQFIFFVSYLEMANKVDITNNILETYPDILCVKTHVWHGVFTLSGRSDWGSSPFARSLTCPCWIPPADPAISDFMWYRHVKRECKSLSKQWICCIFWLLIFFLVTVCIIADSLCCIMILEMCGYVNVMEDKTVLIYHSAELVVLQLQDVITVELGNKNLVPQFRQLSNAHGFN